ncbi:hypothetical protein [Nonomuraea wenchangensis]|uniref:hypothetical protein n=1 Tax=Nonomuraea wenchangensis TaxID=568860 RepID=UPI00331967BE
MNREGLPAGAMSLTLAGMTAWLVAENGFRMARADAITSVTLDVDNDRDDRTKYHPTKWLDRANWVRLVVGVPGEAPMCALTCPGRYAAESLKRLLDMLAEARRKHGDAGGNVYVHAMYQDWPSRFPDPLWKVTSDIPEPEWIRR